jgi:uncharacterized protein (TIGR02118 family)
MHKLTLLFRTPPDVPKFEEDWAHKFVPVVEKMLGILRIEVSNVEGGPDGPSPFYKVHEFYFADRAAMDKAMNSEEGMRAGYTLNAFAKGLFTILFSDVLEDIVREGGQPPETKTPIPNIQNPNP